MKAAKNKPIPKIKGRGRKPVKWRFSLLENVGDSILVSGDPKVLTKSVYSGLRSYNESISPRYIKITMRSEDKGVRVWRTK